MYDPKEVMTNEDFEKLEVLVWNMNNTLQYLVNHSDELKIGEKNPRQLALIYEMLEMVPTYLNGDGEEVDNENSG